MTSIFYSVCGGKLIATGNKQYISTPNFPQDYPPHIDCKWEIEASRADLHVSLNFISFNVEADSRCRFDYARVQSPNGTASPITLCGKLSNIRTIHSEANKMIVEFESDYAITPAGFNASFFSCKNQQ